MHFGDTKSNPNAMLKELIEKIKKVVTTTRRNPQYAINGGIKNVERRNKRHENY